MSQGGDSMSLSTARSTAMWTATEGAVRHSLEASAKTHHHGCGIGHGLLCCASNRPDSGRHVLVI